MLQTQLDKKHTGVFSGVQVTAIIKDCFFPFRLEILTVLLYGQNFLTEKIKNTN